MKLTWSVAASVLAASVAGVALAAPAIATDGITLNAIGTYDLLFKNQTTPSSFWAVDPCDNDADQCIKVTEFGSSDTARKHPHWSKNAYWGVGSWIMEPVEAQRGCKDNTKYSVTYSYSWDAAANTGYRSYSEPGVCDNNKPHDIAAPFTLIKVAPSPPPAG